VKLGRLAAFVFAVAVLGASTARAASFDCAKATTAREKLVCGDPKLSAADDAVAKRYRAALQPLSPDGRKELRAGQRAWLRFVDTICGTAGTQIPPAVVNRYDTPASCLATRYGVRQRQLDQATVVAGKLVIARHESFAATPSDDRYKFVERDIAYPQIDRPAGEAERRWNVEMRSEAARYGANPNPKNSNTDVWLDYKLVTVTPALISTVWSASWYGHGAAHPNNSQLPVNWLIAASRGVAPDDLFDPAKPWQDKLAEHCFAALMNAKDAKNIPYFVKSASELRDVADRADRWTIEHDGLGIQFQPYEIGPYVIGAPKCVIPWDELRPLAAEHPAFAIPPG
jgi:uncharacterized protein